MPLERHIDDLTACDGIKFWMSDGERPVLCRVSHEALRDLAERVHFEGTHPECKDGDDSGGRALPVARSAEASRRPDRVLRQNMSVTPSNHAELGAMRMAELDGALLEQPAATYS